MIRNRDRNVIIRNFIAAAGRSSSSISQRLTEWYLNPSILGDEI